MTRMALSHLPPLTPPKIGGDILSPDRGSQENFTTGPKKIGEILVEHGCITEAQLKTALRYQRQQGGRLAWILATLGYVNRLRLFEALSIQYRLPFITNVELLMKQIDKTLFKGLTHEELIARQALPFRRKNNDEMTLLTADPNNERTLAFFKKHFAVQHVDQVIITDMDLTLICEQIYRKELVDKAIRGVFYRNSEECAYRVFSRRQVFIMGLLFITLLAWISIDVKGFFMTFMWIIQTFYLVCVAFKFVLSVAGAKSEIKKAVADQEIASLGAEPLPVYTVLVPVYKEPAVIGSLIACLRKLDYPQNRLDIILLLEEDDKATYEVAKKAKPPANWRFLMVPESAPRTKPKACNYGLFFALGKYLVIYDAEDRPEKDQLKKAVAAFLKYGETYICFQAALNYYNRNQNFLTRMFTLEYSYWFDYLLPGLDRLKLPIPLGGTSNHFDMEKLRELGGWDPFNTTEDADLGIRAYSAGYKVGLINSTTYEEANARFLNWIRQRTRWIKGYLQTWLVYSRQPISLMRRVGAKSFLAFHFLVGGTPLTFLVNPVMWVLFLYWLITQSKDIEPIFPPVTLYMSLVSLIIGNFLGIYLTMLAVFRRKYFELLPFALLNPVYWIMHSIASWRALWQLFTQPFLWEKTQHGITSRTSPRPVGNIKR